MILSLCFNGTGSRIQSALACFSAHTDLADTTYKREVVKTFYK